MVKKILVSGIIFLTIGIFVIAAGVASANIELPQRILAESSCPVAGCSSNSCHDYDSVPVPDGQHEMRCPRRACASVECHAWDTLTTRYHQASDASMNLWIVAPVVFVLVLVAVMKRA